MAKTEFLTRMYFQKIKQRFFAACFHHLGPAATNTELLVSQPPGPEEFDMLQRRTEAAVTAASVR